MIYYKTTLIGFWQLKQSDMIKEIIQAVKELVGTDYLYFEDALQIKLTPHQEVINIWGVCANKDLYVMDNNQEWHKVEEKDEPVIGTLYQRVKLLQHKYSIAS